MRSLSCCDSDGISKPSKNKLEESISNGISEAKRPVWWIRRFEFISIGSVTISPVAVLIADIVLKFSLVCRLSARDRLGREPSA